jgi:hypothetical protein
MFDWDSLRQFFPVTEKYIYLNHAGVSPLSTQTQSAMEAFLKEVTENGYTNSQMWTETIESCRQSTAKLINANPMRSHSSRTPHKALSSQPMVSTGKQGIMLSQQMSNSHQTYIHGGT